MRKVTLVISLMIFSFLVLIAGERKVVRGGEAEAMVPGAAEIVMDQGGTRPELVDFAEGIPVSLEQAIHLIPGLLGLNAEFSLIGFAAPLEDQTGVHQRYYIAFRGIPLADGMIVAHFRNNRLYALNGNLHTGLDPLNQMLIGVDPAREIALARVGALQYRWDDAREEDHLKLETGNPEATYFPTGSQLWFPSAENDINGHRLAWKFIIYAVNPLDIREIIVDAASGEVLSDIDLLITADVTGLAVTKYSGNQEITTDSTATGYRLRETGRGNGIETYNMLTGTSYGAAVDFTDSDNYWNNFNAQKDEVATDAHWGAEKTYDYYYDVHGRNSIDDNGFALRSYVHYDVAYANAFWDGYRMTYGDGNGSMGPLVALDVVAHEISHGLTSFTANLVYSYESGAMNEAFSDIFGTAVEFFAKPLSANWTIGENIGGAFRSMSNPNAFGDPDTYLGNNWYSGSNDNGGVHTNSGVLNHWFYLLSVGGSGTNDIGNAYNVTGIGVLDAGRVAYRMLSVYLTSNSQHTDARFYGIKAATDLFGACTPQVAAVTNAFYAVGIGQAYYNGVIAAFDASATSFCSVPAQVEFTNNTVNGLSYTWDFGDGNTSTSYDPVHYYSQAGLFTVKLTVDGGACGSDTTVIVDLIDVNPPAPPAVVHAESCGPDSLVLVAVGSDSIHWYAPGNVFLARGDTFITPLLNQSVTYYAYNVVESPPVYGGKPNNSGGGSYFTASNSHHLVFNAAAPVILRSVKVYASSAGYRTISLITSGGTTLAATSVNIPAGESRVQLDFNVPPGTGHRLAGPGSPDLYRNNSGCTYPYTAGPAVTITGSSAATNPTGYYYYFYDWEIEEAPCVSLPVPVQAFINAGPPQAAFSFSQSGDTVLFQYSGYGANSLVWDFGDGYTSVLTNPRHLYDSSGIYNVSLSVFNACGNDSIVQTIPVLVTSRVQAFEPEDVILYPNPVGSIAWISGFQVIGTDAVMLVTDIQGRQVAASVLQPGNIHPVQTDALKPGIYFILLKDGVTTRSLKLIKD